MGVTTARHWSDELISHGKQRETPAAIIRRCSLPQQQTIRCTLGEVAERMEHEKDRIRPPAIVIVGDVASLSPALAWFEQRPLFGASILVTRPREQAEMLELQLAELGAEVLFQPAIEISDPPDWRPVDEAIARIAQFDWLAFTSANGVRYFLERLLATGRDLRSLGNIEIAVIGPGTAQALADYRIHADVQPERFDAESLAAELAPAARGKKFLYPHASRGRDTLARELTKAGAVVEEVVVYTNSDVRQPDPEIAQRLAAGGIEWTTVTSSAIARSLAALFGPDLKKSRLASISPITSQALRDVGHEPAAEAAEYTMQGLVEAILSSQGPPSADVD
jgi:uroporphyrinogen III methyltransferase/synthase